MAQIINIAGAQAIDDPEYRYKMPRIIGKVEGRGNGIKTAIPNMVDVPSSLHRPPGEVTKFFGCELGAQTTYNDDTERSIVNGAHETRVLQDKLSVYIEKFVLCPACKLPETSYKIKHEIIYHNCLACGAREPCDMQHKLTTYILKQHKIEKKVAACVEINQCVGYRQFFTKSFSVTTWPLWLRRAVRNRHRHAIEQTNAP